MLKLYTIEQYKMQNSSPNTDPSGSSAVYNDSGYFTNHNPGASSLSSNSNSDPTFEVNEDISLHLKPKLTVQSSSAIYFCENAVFDEPKLVGAPLLCDTNNYEQFSSLIKFSLEETSSSYLNNCSVIDSSNSEYNFVQNIENIAVGANLNQSEVEDSRDCSMSVLSPELFSDPESEDESQIIEIEPSFSANLTQTQRQVPLNDEFIKNDRKLLKRVQETLTGVPPPPSLTIIQISVSEMLEKIDKNKHLFLTGNIDDLKEENIGKPLDQSLEEKNKKSLLVSCTKNELEENNWPNIMNLRFHGLHYNRSSVSEDFELSCSRYLSRYVGCETSSSCSAGPQRKGQRPAGGNSLRWAPKSPGRRLSHLARRRITFSSANLQQNASMSVLGNSSNHNKLLIDTRKTSNKCRRSPRKSPWKKSPRKSPHKRVKTPSSSSKKRSVRRLNMDDSKPSSSKLSSTKRALFQSPEKSRPAPSTADAVIKSRRSLFSSPTKKRKRPEEDCSQQPNKFPRSQSFDVNQTAPLNEITSSIQRRNSEIIVRPGKGDLSELHKQKMLWAVSESLRAHQITMSHPQFRQFASILCKIVKLQVPDLMSNSNGPRQPGSTSDRMLKIARRHVYDVTRGKTFPEILQNIQNEEKRFKQPRGYVAPPDKQVLKDKVNIQDEKCKSGGKSHDLGEKRPDENSKLKSIKRQILFEDNR